jgi:hypothetical protein
MDKNKWRATDNTELILRAKEMRTTKRDNKRKILRPVQAPNRLAVDKGRCALPGVVNDSVFNGWGPVHDVSSGRLTTYSKATLSDGFLQVMLPSACSFIVEVSLSYI